jgi:cytochrome P450
VELPARIEQARKEYQAGITHERETIFEALFNSDLPDEEKKTMRLTGEGLLMLTAGTETTSWVLGAATYYLLSQPDMLARLTKEIKAVAKDPLHVPSWSTLEQIPYLYGVVQESIRLAYGTSSRTARLATEENLVYHGKWTPPSSKTPVETDYVVPRGWAIGMSAVTMNHAESVFPDSHVFDPERWLDEAGEKRKDLDRYLFSFSKGSRACLGIK